MAEKVKRLVPTSDTLRELYLKSGNVCAFPGCSNIMVNLDGDFIGQVCHIEAADEGGPRFNADQSNEDRRSFPNLMLMCYEHHTITHNEKRYSIEDLKKMKQQHEIKFSSILDRISNSIVDLGFSRGFCETIECSKLSTILSWKCSSDENKENSKKLNSLLHKVEMLPIETRSLLIVMLRRSFLERNSLKVDLQEIEKAIDRDSRFMLNHIEILKRYDIVSDHYEDDYGRYFVDFTLDDCGWNYWIDIKHFSEIEGIDLKEILVDLNFSCFD